MCCVLPLLLWFFRGVPTDPHAMPIICPSMFPAKESPWRGLSILIIIIINFIRKKYIYGCTYNERMYSYVASYCNRHEMQPSHWSKTFIFVSLECIFGSWECILDESVSWMRVYLGCFFHRTSAERKQGARLCVSGSSASF